ncbi:MAG: restriction endonuclease [Proteobacteria bacterium]|nr:restriction endonuclease [Pseudomonadota bacterium]
MAVPTYDHFIEPILRYLAQQPDGASARDVHEAAADALGVTDEDRQAVVPSGTQLVYKNRAGWAHDRLKRAGLSSSPRRGYWQLTQDGMTFAARHGAPLSADQIEHIARAFVNLRLSPRGDRESDTVHFDADSTSDGIASPDDRLSAAFLELRQSVTEELLDTLGKISPAFFESIVLNLLHRMGYGAHRADLQRLGGTGDGGVDGVISLDRLGLEKVYVQAKRWQPGATVGRPDIQAFYGALAGQRSRKGVFITTSSYSAQALEFARSVEGLVLVDGMRLAELMIDHEVGVSSRTVRVPRLDSDYFDEGI